MNLSCHEFWQGIPRTAPIKSLCFYFTIPAHFIHSTIKVFKYYFVLISLIFYFPYNFVPLQRNAPSPAVPRCFTLKGHKHRTLSLEGVNLKDTNPPFGSVSTFRSQMKQGKHPFVWEKHLLERKSWSPTNCFLYGVFDHCWYEFQLKCW